MIMTVEELKKYVDTEEKDSVLEAKLQALELLIRKYTNNNYQDRNRRFVAPVDAVAGFQYASPTDVQGWRHYTGVRVTLQRWLVHHQSCGYGQWTHRSE